MAEKMRFGIIGCGVIGDTHAKAISSIPDARLIAVADVVAENAQKLAEIYGVTPYTNAQETLEREQLDVVDICTPSGLHGELACQAMRTGHHVIVEKPMEISREAIVQMLRVQRESGVKIAVISQHRFDPRPNKCTSWYSKVRLAGWCWATRRFPGGALSNITTAGHGAAPGKWMVAAS